MKPVESFHENAGDILPADDHYRRIADCLSQPAWISDADGQVFWYNRLWHEHTGAGSEGEGRGEWWSFHDPAIIDRLKKNFQTAVESGLSWEDTVSLKSRAGEWRWFLFRVNPVKDDSGKPVRWLGTYTDITDRRNAESRVVDQLKREQRYKALFDSIDEGFCIVEMMKDTRGKVVNYRYLEINPAFEHHTGMKQAAGKTALDFDPHHERYWFDLYGTIAETGEPQRAVSQALNGQWFEVYGFRMEPAEDKHVAILFSNITQRKNAELAVIESDRRFRDMADSISQMVWVTRPDGYHEYYNRRWYEFTGVDRGSTDGMVWDDIIHAEDQKRATACWQHSLRTGEPYEVEYRLRRADGVYRWVLGRAECVKDETGNILKWYGTCTDIGVQKDREEFIESILASSPDCIKVISKEGSLLLMNEGGLKQMELEDFNTCRNVLWADLWPVEEKRKIQDAMARALKGEAAKFEGFCGTAKGTPKWWEVIVTPLKNAEGRSEQMLVISRDITARRKADEALAKSEESWRTLTEAMPQLVWVDRGSDGYCEYLSSQWEHYTGKPVRELLGFAWLELLHPDDRERTAIAWQESVAGVAEYNIDYRIRRFDGTYRWFKTRGVPAKDEQGNITFWYGTCTDIQDLVETRQQAEAANVAKSEFLANMSHEIRTPMNAVVGLANILARSSPLTPKQQQYVGTLRLSADTLLALINDLLDIAKIESQVIELERIPFDMLRFLEELVSIMSVRATEKRLDFHFENHDITGRTFLGDPTRLRQILMNLCSNAIKFTETGSITLSCRPEKVEQDKTWIIFEVKDTGIGITPRQLETVFDKFVQADSTISRKYGGTGLGLAITRTLTNRMGGSIHAESDICQGSVFKVILPFGKDEL